MADTTTCIAIHVRRPPRRTKNTTAVTSTRHRDRVAIPLAAGVLAAKGILLSPAMGAILMSASTVVVAINAQLLRRLKL